MLRNLIKIFQLTIITLLAISCNMDRKAKLLEISLTSAEGNQVNFKSTDIDSHTIFIFLSPDCPFCINYTKTIIDLMSDTAYKEFQFYAVYSGNVFSNTQIIQFQKQYNFQIESLMDNDLELTKLLGASVNPQVVIINGNAETVYSGAIDNWAVDTGRKRQVISKHYLKDALDDIINGNKPIISNTKPVGCFIEL